MKKYFGIALLALIGCGNNGAGNDTATDEKPS